MEYGGKARARQAALGTGACRIGGGGKRGGPGLLGLLGGEEAEQRTCTTHTHFFHTTD